MAFGIEARLPFLDVRLVEMAVRLPDRLRLNRGITKAILRRAMYDRLPTAILDRRDKRGFDAPQQAWLAGGRLQIRDLLEFGQVCARGWVERSEIERVLAGGFSGGRATEQLWRLFITEVWLRSMWPDATGSRGRASWEAALSMNLEEPTQASPAPLQAPSR